MDETERIYARYRGLLRDYLPLQGVVLKTDCFNEAKGGFKSLGHFLDSERTVYLEIDKDIISEAMERCRDLDIRHGDIRDMPFQDGSFACVVDFSTIDHVPPEDTPVVLGEYARVLRRDGILILVVWCSEKRKTEPVDWGGLQYFFFENDVRNALKNVGLDVWHSGVIHRHEDLYLMELIGGKK